MRQDRGGFDDDTLRVPEVAYWWSVVGGWGLVVGDSTLATLFQMELVGVIHLNFGKLKNVLSSQSPTPSPQIQPSNHRNFESTIHAIHPFC
jgi:hypothetical protein